MASDLSLLAQFDDYCRKVNIVLQNDCSKEFLAFAQHQERFRLKWKESVMECKRLKIELDDEVAKVSELEKKLNKARMMVDTEKKCRIKADTDKEELASHVEMILDLMSCIGGHLPTGTKEKLEKFLNTTQAKIRISCDTAQRLETIDEGNRTESIISDLSYTRSEDNLDLDLSRSNRLSGFKKPRRSLSPTYEDAPTVKKRRSSRLRKSTGERLQKTTTDQLIATTTVTVPKTGPVTACSVIETIPNSDIYQPSAPPKTSSDTDSDVCELLGKCMPASSPVLSALGKLYTRPHCFRVKTLLKPNEDCGFCLKKIGFGKNVSYCAECRVVTHVECKEKVLMPCIQLVETPRRNGATSIADYCSKVPPMIPPLLVHCIMEVEARGLIEVGIYRVPGSEREVRSLKERFLRGKGVCSLSSYDINVICGTIKDFLRGLKEPLVTLKLRGDFVRGAEHALYTDPMVVYSPLVSQLPQPNRDTLAFLIQHLQKVSLSADCKMSKNNLARVFGPTIVGYGEAETTRNMYQETEKLVQVVQCLLDLPDDYWNKFVNDDNGNQAAATPIGSLGFRRRHAKNFKLYTPPLK